MKPKNLKMQGLITYRLHKAEFPKPLKPNLYPIDLHKLPTKPTSSSRHTRPDRVFTARGTWSNQGSING